ncbi:hypothetical protein D3C78_1365440 [compost metagenome]
MLQILWCREMAVRQFDNFQRIEHATWANVTAGLAAAVWPPQQHAARLQSLQVGLGGDGTIHLLVHGGGCGNGCRGGQANGGQ